jgi:quinol monooxygenase YgiN
MFVVIARIKAKEGQGDKLQTIFEDMVRWVAENEAETVTYSCNRSHDDGTCFTFFERYSSKAAFEAHSRSQKFAEMAGSLRGLVDGPIGMETYEEVAGKF